MGKLRIIILTLFSFQRLFFLFQLHLVISIMRETFRITERRPFCTLLIKVRPGGALFNSESRGVKVTWANRYLVITGDTCSSLRRMRHRMREE